MKSNFILFRILSTMFCLNSKLQMPLTWTLEWFHGSKSWYFYLLPRFPYPRLSPEFRPAICVTCAVDMLKCWFSVSIFSSPFHSAHWNQNNYSQIVCSALSKVLSPPYSAVISPLLISWTLLLVMTTHTHQA